MVTVAGLIENLLYGFPDAVCAGFRRKLDPGSMVGNLRRIVALVPSHGHTHHGHAMGQGAHDRSVSGMGDHAIRVREYLGMRSVLDDLHIVRNAEDFIFHRDSKRHQSAYIQLRQGIDANWPLASVLDRLAVALPDDTWLDRFEVNGDQIRVTGLTSNAADLMARVSKQPDFADVRATAATVRDETQNKERFGFEMRWRGRVVKP